MVDIVYLLLVRKLQFCKPSVLYKIRSQKLPDPNHIRQN